MFRFFFVLILLSSATFTWADTAKCTIKVQDINSGTTYTIDQTFNFQPNGNAKRKHFDLSGTQYACTLAFFDLDSGTMLSCGNKNDAGHTFFQSDRSAVKEAPTNNNLSFRIENSFFTLKSSCK